MALTTGQLDKVRKLFAMANDPAATEAERESFNAKVCELMTRWEIDEAELAKAPDARPEDITRHHYTVAVGHATTGASVLVAAIVRNFGGALYWEWEELDATEHGYKWGQRLTVYCTDSQFETITLWADHLISQLKVDVTRDKPRSRKSYAMGWASRIGRRLAERFEQDRPTDVRNRYAVALVDAKTKMANENGRMRSAKISYGSADANSGYQAGGSASFPGASVGGGQLALGRGR